MTVQSIRVDEIPGGVWTGAQIITPDGRAAVESDEEPGLYYVPGLGLGRPRNIGEFYLDLTDELGLGLAGLAARVAQRLGLSDFIDDPYLAGLAEYLVTQCEWYPEESGKDFAPIVTAAQYLALTDRLCAAVGLERKGHEVALWDFHAGHAVYFLRTGRGSWRSAEDGPWLPALRAALGAK